MDRPLGHIGKFDASREEWDQYAERMRHFFKVNAIESAEKRKTCFLTMIGAPLYKLLTNVIAPERPADRHMMIPSRP